MSDPVMEAVDVVKVLGEGAGKVRALKGVSMALAGGELALLMGPSGSGKTTLLSILGCMLSPTEGTVRVRGNSTAGLKAEQLAKLRRDHIGFVFQSYHLFPTLTALDNVRLTLDVRGQYSQQAAAKASDALAAVGLAHKLNSFPSELSGGEQQRVAIARAIVADAAAILADEPTAALDSENGQSIMSVLADIAKNPQRGVLVVTHDPRTLPFASRIVSIEDGRIVGEEAGARRRKNKAGREDKHD
jgi:putative ABC transport system ATP-binding protein